MAYYFCIQEDLPFISGRLGGFFTRELRNSAIVFYKNKNFWQTLKKVKPYV